MDIYAQKEKRHKNGRLMIEHPEKRLLKIFSGDLEVYLTSLDSFVRALSNNMFFLLCKHETKISIQLMC